MADAKPRPRSEEAIQEAKTQRANKLAQYFRILPCPFTQRVFCYAACLLKWFKAEQQRIELLTQLLEAQKQHLSPPIPHLNAGESGGGEGDEEGDEEEWEWEVEEEEGEEALPTAPTERVSTSVKSARKSMGEVEVRSGHKEIDLSAYDGEEENELEAEEEEKEEEEEIEETRMVAPSEALTPAVTKPCVFRIPFADTTEKRLAYNLAFSAMKYYSILDKIVDEVGFYGEYPDLREEEYLVLVTLYDYTARSYQRRTSTDAEMAVTISDEVDMKSPRYAGRTIIYPPTLESFQTVEQAVINMSVHFAAAVARTRVKEQVGSLHLLLPVEWREAESMAENMPFYGWYNQLLGKSEVVLNWLKENNFTRVKGRLPNALEFAEDEHCPDVFVFNTADRAAIMESQIVRDRFLIIQDKSNLFALHCLLAFMGPGEEVMLVNHPNSLNGIHLEGLLMNKFPTVTPVPTVRIVRQAKENEDPKLIPKCGCRNLSMFKDMWTPNDNPQKVTKRAELLSKNAVYLKHALKFNQVRTVIFVSHSEDADETETAVQRCVEYANCTLQREVEANATSSRPATSTPGFVCRLPPGIPALAEAEAAISAGEAAPNLITASQCIHFAPSNLHNGFFIACIKKEVCLTVGHYLPTYPSISTPFTYLKSIRPKLVPMNPLIYPFVCLYHSVPTVSFPLPVSLSQPASVNLLVPPPLCLSVCVSRSISLAFSFIVYLTIYMPTCLHTSLGVYICSVLPMWIFTRRNVCSFVSPHLSKHHCQSACSLLFLAVFQPATAFLPVFLFPFVHLCLYLLSSPPPPSSASSSAAVCIASVGRLGVCANFQTFYLPTCLQDRIAGLQPQSIRAMV